MRTVNMLEAKTNLSRLVEAVENGSEDEVIIARSGKPVARLVPLAPKKKVRLGLANGLYNVPATLEEFNAMDKEIEELFLNSSLFPDDDDRENRSENEPAQEFPKQGSK